MDKRRMAELQTSQERAAVIAQCKAAHSLDSIAAAESALAAWIEANPDDDGLWDLGQLLSRRRDFYARQSVAA